MGGSNPSAEPAASTAPAGSPQSAPGPEPRRVGILARWTAWIGALQAEFNRDLTAGLKGLKDGGAFWWLGGISFLYGIVHAAGPGHGKVVISSYLVANEARVRRGVAIAFVAAFVQAIVAVAVIGVLAVILNMTSMAIDRTAKLFEAGSFALVAALGAYLLARKGRATWAMMKDAFPSPLRGGARGGVALSSPATARHGHGHDHFGHSHAHHHPAPIPSPQGGGEAPSLAGAAAAVLSVGIRPCTGALVVLVFALSQGIFWAGVASTFVMALGTAMTVAVLAAIAVGAKDLARSLSQGDDRRGAYAMLGLELAAALFIAALGTVLFVGTLAT
jgi:ABC-type nickel/cobalt efflux system permease component RcnA